MTEPSIQLTRLIITRIVGTDGELGFTFEHEPERISFVETLGLLSAAEWHVKNSMNAQYGEQQ